MYEVIVRRACFTVSTRLITCDKVISAVLDGRIVDSMGTEFS